MDKPRSKHEWIKLAKITHTQSRTAHILKSVLHGLIGVAMAAAFAGGHVFTLGALAIGAALFTTIGILAVRLGVAVTPEKKILSRALTKAVTPKTATVMTRNPAVGAVASEHELQQLAVNAA